MNLVLKYKNVIENKQTSKIRVDAKVKKWKDIQVEFNAKSGVIFRSADVLRKKYDNLKKLTKKKVAEEKKQIYATGGGPCISVKEVNEIDTVMLDIIGAQIDGLESTYDSDVIQEVATENSAGGEGTSSQNIDQTDVDLGLAGNSFEVSIELDADINNITNEDNPGKHKEQEKEAEKRIQKDKFVIGTRRSKALQISKKVMSADKWQLLAEKKIQLVEEQIEKNRLETKLMKEKHDLEMKNMFEEHELKCKLSKKEFDKDNNNNKN